MTFRFAEAEDGTPIPRFIRQLADYGRISDQAAATD